MSDSEDQESPIKPPLLDLPQAPPPKRLSKAERKALEEKRKREAAAQAAKRGPKIAPKMGKFVADRGTADEKARVVGLFKEFCDRGKVPLSMLPPLVKELFKPIEKELKSLTVRLTGVAKEALSDKAAGGLQTGDLTTWYFDVAWPMITEARHEAKAAAEAQKAAEAKAAAEAEEARKAAEAEEAERTAKEAEEARKVLEAEAAEAAAKREAEAEEARRREEEKLEEERKAQQAEQPSSAPQTRDSSPVAQRQQQSQDPLQQNQQNQQNPQQSSQRLPGDSSSGSDNLRVETSGLQVQLPSKPAGWVVGRGIDLAESRRLLALLQPRALASDDPRRGAAKPTEVLIPLPAAKAVLAEALLPVEDAELLAGAPKPTKGTGGVPIGPLLHFWFEHVWPKHQEALQDPGGLESPEKSTGEAAA